MRDDGLSGFALLSMEDADECGMEPAPSTRVGRLCVCVCLIYMRLCVCVCLSWLRKRLTSLVQRIEWERVMIVGQSLLPRQMWDVCVYEGVDDWR